jgi:hypothetical protein
VTAASPSVSYTLSGRLRYDAQLELADGHCRRQSFMHEESIPCYGLNSVYLTRSPGSCLLVVVPPIKGHADGVHDVVRLQKAARAPWVAVTCRVPRPGEGAEASTPAVARREMACLDVGDHHCYCT